MKKLLVIVDMVNGFVHEGALADNEIDKITPVIVGLIQMAIEKKVPIVAFKDTHTVDDVEFEIYPPHCIKGTSECELVPELKKYENKMISIEKSTTNGFNTKEFRSIVNKINFEEIVIVGCCTDICVETLATSLIAFNKEKNRNTKITVIENGVYTFNSANHNAEKEHFEALKRMARLGVEIKKCNSYAKTSTAEK